MKLISFIIIISIFLSSLLSFFLLKVFITSYKAEKFFEIEKIKTLERLIDSIYRDFENFISIAVPRIFKAIISYEVENGIFFENIQKTFEDIFLDKNYYNISSDLLYNSTFNSYVLKISNIGKNITLIPKNLKIYQNSSFSVTFDIELEVKIKEEKLEINQTRKIKREISILGFEDPYYTINAKGKAVNFIKDGSYLIFINVSNFTFAVNNQLCFPSLNAPCFLDRLEGKSYLTEKCSIGYFCLVDKSYLSNSGIDVFPERSNVDYIYFSEINISTCKIQNLDSNLYRIDVLHARFFNLTQIIYDCT
ncbi:MAG: hypothetical protein QXQ14_03715 [Candidatus Aenigmatarchaeota archaeon]